jgi:hypothetical protein
MREVAPGLYEATRQTSIFYRGHAMAEQGETARHGRMSVDEAIQRVGKLHGVIESRVDPYWTRHNIGLMAARHASVPVQPMQTATSVSGLGPGPDPIHCTCGFTAALAAPRAEDGTGR